MEVFDACHGDENRRRLRALVEDRRIPGLLAYQADKPVGWVSVAPRQEYARLQRSPVTKPVDDVPAWSITCFVIHREHRGEGVATVLLRAAVDCARSRGAVAVEGYPVDPDRKRRRDSDVFHGLASMFETLGFKEEMARRSATRPLMRLRLD